MEVDLHTGAKMLDPADLDDYKIPPRTWKNLPMRIVRSLF